MRTACRLALFAAALVAAVVTEPAGAQSTEDRAGARRQWIAGKVLRAGASEPWSGARVRLHSRPWGVSADPSFLDAVAVRADARGLFRAAVLPGRSYCVWAVSDVVDGQYRVSRLANGASAGQPVELVESTELRTVVRIEVGGLDARRERAPFTFEAMCMMSSRLDVRCASPEPGVAVLPPVPVARPFLRVRDRDGYCIASGVVPVSVAWRRARLAGEAPDPNPDNLSRARAPFETLSVERTGVRVSPPRTVRIRLVGAAGARIAGASLLHADRADRRRWATTDVDGEAELLVPAVWSERGEPALRYLAFWTEAPNHATTHVYRHDLHLGDGAMVIALAAGRWIRGRLLWAAGAPASRQPLLLHTGVPAGHGRGASYGGSPLVYWTDDDGRFSIPGRPGDLGWQLTTFLRDGDGEMLPRSGMFPLAPRIVLASGHDVAGRDRELGDLVLRDYRPIDVELVDAEGQAVVGRSLHFREALDARQQERRVATVRTDWQGRIRLLARPGAQTIVSTVRPRHGLDDQAATRVEVERGEAPIRLRLTVEDGR